MRLVVVTLATLGASLSLVLAACGEEASVSANLRDADGGSIGASGSTSGGTSGISSSSSSGAPVDAGSDAGIDAGDAEVLTQPKTTMLRSGVVTLVGITSGPTPYAVYFAPQGGGRVNVEAVPVSGGAFVSLRANVALSGFAAGVFGGVVAWFDYATSAWTVWTASTGIKTIATTSSQHVFAASEDGSRILYARRPANAETPIEVVVTTTAAPGTTPTLPPAKWATLQFVGQTVVGTYQRQGIAGERSRLVTIPPGGSPQVRIDDESTPETGPIRYMVAANHTGNRVVVIADNGAQLVKLDALGATATTFDTDCTDGEFTADDTTWVYRTADRTLKRLSTSGPVLPITLESEVADYRLARSSKHAVFRTGFGSGPLDVVDLTTPTPQPITLDPLQVFSFNAAFVGSGTHVVYLDESGIATPPVVVSKRVDGAGAMTLLSGRHYAAPESDSVLMTAGPEGAMVLSWVDGAKGIPLQPLGPIDRHLKGWWSRNTFVYTAAPGGTDGLYATRVP